MLPPTTLLTSLLLTTGWTALITILDVRAAAVDTSGYPDPIEISGVIRDVDSPSLCKYGDTYYLFSTGRGVRYMTSTDRLTWGGVTSIFESNPAGTLPYTGATDNVWAPDCTVVGDTFYVYYAASSGGSQNSGIFLAKSIGGPDNWTDEGLVVGTTAESVWNAIDAHLLIDPTYNADKPDWWLTAGSWWKGIYIFQLDPATGKIMADSTVDDGTAAEGGQFIAGRNGGAIEASWLMLHESEYFLYTSFDSGYDGTASTYNVRVAKTQTTPLASYQDETGALASEGGGTEVLGSHGTVYGPGGQSLFTDDNGDILLVYHRQVADANGKFKSTLSLNIIEYQDGWPVVVAGNGNPLTSTPTTSSVVAPAPIASTYSTGDEPVDLATTGWPLWTRTATVDEVYPFTDAAGFVISFTAPATPTTWVITAEPTENPMITDSFAMVVVAATDDVAPMPTTTVMVEPTVTTTEEVEMDTTTTNQDLLVSTGTAVTTSMLTRQHKHLSTYDDPPQATTTV